MPAVQGSESGDGEDETSHNQLGLINGVIVPCSLNILGVVLFLWLPWAVGQAGGQDVLGMFLLGETQTIFTVLSLSAIVSNGSMAGGGSYFMISRSLGPELGGAMGTLFYLSYAVSATFYAAGFGKEIQQTFFPSMDGAWDGMFLTLCSSLGLLLVLGVSLIGAQFFTKINTLLFALQFGSIFVAAGSIFFGTPSNSDGGFQTSSLHENWKPGYSNVEACDGKCNFQKVFAIIFPAVTGVMEGANLSGDLKNPGRDIGRGTLIAVVLSFLVYMMLMVAFMGSFTRHELVTNEAIFQDACVNKYIVVIGILVSTSSSCLGAIFGGSRVLQALARDEIFPKTKWMGQGTKRGDEPWVGVIITWAIAQLCMFVGGLDKIAPIISTFFCLSYACCNLACLLVTISGTPNFRPRFKYFTWHTCLIGLLLNIFVMFFLNPIYAGVAILVMTALFVWLIYKAPQKEWGDVRQALMFHQVRKYLLRLDTTEHGKTWRPSVLLLVNDLNGPLIEFCNYLKKGGLYVLGNVVLGSHFNKLTKTAQRMKAALTEYIRVEKLKAFPAVAVGRSSRSAYQNLLVTSGLGAMSPNTVVVPFIESISRGKAALVDAEVKVEVDTKSRSATASPTKSALVKPGAKSDGKDGKATPKKVAMRTGVSFDNADDDEAPSLRELTDGQDRSRSQSQIFEDISLAMENKQYSDSNFFESSVNGAHVFVNLIQDALTLSKNVLITRNFQLLTQDKIERSRFIDIWLLDPKSVRNWRAFESQAILMIELANILLQNKAWGSQCSLRVLMPIVPDESRVGSVGEADDDSDDAKVEVELTASGEPLLTSGVGTESQVRALLLERLYTARIDVEHVIVVPVDTPESLSPLRLNKLVKERSGESLLVLLPLPTLPNELVSTQSCGRFYDTLDVLSEGLPPVAFLSRSASKTMSLVI